MDTDGEWIQRIHGTVDTEDTGGQWLQRVQADSGYRETVDIQCATGAEHFCENFHFRENLFENFAKMIMKLVEIS